MIGFSPTYSCAYARGSQLSRPYKIQRQTYSRSKLTSTRIKLLLNIYAKSNCFQITRVPRTANSLCLEISGKYKTLHQSMRLAAMEFGLRLCKLSFQIAPRGLRQGPNLAFQALFLRHAVFEQVSTSTTGVQVACFANFLLKIQNNAVWDFLLVLWRALLCTAQKFN